VRRASRIFAVAAIVSVLFAGAVTTFAATLVPANGVISGNWTSPNVWTVDSFVIYNFSGDVAGHSFQLTATGPSNQSTNNGMWIANATFLGTRYHVGGNNNDDGLLHVLSGTATRKGAHVSGTQIVATLKWGYAVPSKSVTWKFTGDFDHRALTGTLVLSYKNGSISSGSIHGTYRLAP
jgi:hypothetical protein